MSRTKTKPSRPSARRRNRTGRDGDLGEGEQEIKKVVDGERVDTELRFKKPFEATNNAYMITEMVNDAQTKVKWGFSGSVPKPFNVMCLVVDMDKMVGKDFEEGLASLKTKLEQ